MQTNTSNTIFHLNSFVYVGAEEVLARFDLDEDDACWNKKAFLMGFVL